MAILLAKPLITLGASLQRWCQLQKGWVPSQLQVFEAMSHLMIWEPIPEQEQAVALLQRFAQSLQV